MTTLRCPQWTFHALCLLPIATFLTVAPITPAQAQQAQTGTVSGQVLDEAGAALAGAQVVIEALGKGTLTDARGRYTLSDVPVGSHTVQVIMIGYRTQRASVTVSAGAAATADFTLAVDPLELEGIVVTGSFTPREKLESSVAISTISSDQLEMAEPRSTTEMLRYVPGFTRVESSGGEVNQNISMRGILGVEYVMFMEDGLPVFPTMHTFFMNADNLFRPDENIERLEVVRGGSSGLFGSNTPGAIVNFINKSGGPEINGAVKASAATGEFARYDFNLNGPIAEDWRFNIGGFYRYDRGVRDPGYPGIRGGQLKANVTRQLESGYLRASLKFIDDRNQFYLPLPFRNPDDPEYVPGFTDFGAMATLEGNHVRVPTPVGELELPLDNGLRTKAYWLTADVGFELPQGWSLQNAAQIMRNDQEWNAIVPFDILPRDLAELDFLQGYYGRYYAGVLQGNGTLPADMTIDSIRAVPGYDIDLLFTNHFDDLGNKLPYNTANDLLAPGGEWHVEKPISAFQDQFQLQKNLDPHSLSLGLYFANYTQTNRWFFTDVMMDVRDNPRFVDVAVNDADLTFYWTDDGAVESQTVNIADLEGTQNGFRRFVSNYVNGDGSTTIFSAVLGGSFQLNERLRADAGVRYETNKFVQTSENSSTFDLDGDESTLYDATVWGNKTFRHFSRSLDDWAASIGLNYRLTDQIAVYAQGSRGFKMPALDEFLVAAAQEQISLFEPRRVWMGEGGVKYSTARFGFTVNGFYGLLKNIVGQGAVLDPVTGGTVWVVTTSPENRSWGAEVEISGRPTQGLDVLAQGTFLKAELGAGAGADIGSWINGVPPVLANLAVTYAVPNSNLNLLGDWHLVGRRFSDVRAEVKLPAYNYFNFGASYRIPGQGISISASLLNAFQSKGLEEGNPRLALLPGGRTNENFLARPLLPRRFEMSVRYDF